MLIKANAVRIWYWNLRKKMINRKMKPDIPKMKKETCPKFKTEGVLSYGEGSFMHTVVVMFS